MSSRMRATISFWRSSASSGSRMSMISYAFTVPDSSFPRSEAASPARAAREEAAPDEAGSRPSIAGVLPCPGRLRRGRVRRVNRNTAFGLGALLGAAAAFVWDRRTGQRPATSPPQEAPQRELRQKLAEAQRAQVDEDDFGAAGMGAEPLVEEAAPPRPPAP